jgi:tetratricopeptide (TPR) repeat protein
LAGVEDIIARVLARNERGAQPVALCVAAETLLTSGDLDGSLTCFDYALRLTPQLARAWTGRAATLLKMGRAPEAVACMNRALEEEPGFPGALVLKGDVLRKRGVRDEALACYEQALATNPAEHEAWLARAGVLYELRRMSEAKVACERFLTLAPEDHGEYLTACMMMKELERAIAREPLPREDPLSARATKAAVPNAERKSGRHTPSALKAQSPAVSRTPTPARTRKKSDRGAGMTGGCGGGGGGGEKKSVRLSAEKKSVRTPSERSLEKAAERKSIRGERRPSGKMSASSHAAVKIADKSGLTADDLAVFDEVRALSLANRNVEALRKLEPIVKRCPDAREAWFLRAHILVPLNQYDAALSSVERAARLDARDVDTATLTVKVLVAMKKDDRALAAADRVLTLVPRDAEAHRVRGDCLVVLMRQGEAVFSYEKVIHYLPDDAAAWLALGRTLRQLRRFAEARMALTKALTLAKRSAPELVAQTNEFIAKLPPEG